MNRLIRRLLSILVLAALAAGCTSTTNGGPDGGDGATPPAQMSNAEARTLLTTAASSMPDRFGMDMVIRSAGKDALTMSGAFDNATGEGFIEIKGDASIFGEQAAQTGADYFANGVTIYTTREGSLYLSNGTAFVFPPEGKGGGLVPPPDKSPLAGFVDPTSSFEDFEDENTTVHSVTPLVHEGKPAVRLVVSTAQEERTVNATVIVWTSPARLAQIESTLPVEEDDANNPLSGATAIIDFAYGSDVKLQTSEAATRALGLGYTSNKNAFAYNDNSPTIWTFQRSGGVALADVEARVKDPASADESGDGPMDYAKLDDLWSMKLSDKTKTQGGLTLTFDDVDADGKVSANDTLTISGGESPTVVLFDTKTQTYVVPGLGPIVLLGGILAVAALLRRK